MAPSSPVLDPGKCLRGCLRTSLKLVFYELYFTFYDMQNTHCPYKPIQEKERKVEIGIKSLRALYYYIAVDPFAFIAAFSLA
jgi:hypothetical protein